jgi:predicted phosphodiesterase
MLRAVSTTDWHLMGLKRLFPKDHIRRQIKEIRKPFQYAIENGVKHMFVLGDISDTPFIDETALIALIRLILEYDDHLNVHYICGNHDYSDVHKTSMEMLGLLQDEKFFKRLHIHFAPEQLVIDGEVVNFLPWPKMEYLKHRRPTLNLCHIEHAGAVGDNGKPLKTKSKFVRREADFVVSGHIHQYQYVRSQRLIYPGALYQKTFGEKLPKGFIDLKCGVQNGKLEVRHRFVTSSPEIELLNLYIESERDFSQLRSDPHIRYKLHVSEGVVIPADLTTTYPTVFQVVGRGRKGVEREEHVNAAGDVPELDLMSGLIPFLKDEGLGGKMLRAAVSEVKNATNVINGSQI